jgi:hypothetical protein
VETRRGEAHQEGEGFYDELIVLELQTKAVLRLMKAKLLIETVVAAEPISKETLTSDEIKKYLNKKRRQSKSIQESACNAD